jgi:hypothetical protein
MKSWFPSFPVNHFTSLLVYQLFPTLLRHRTLSPDLLCVILDKKAGKLVYCFTSLPVNCFTSFMVYQFTVLPVNWFSGLLAFLHKKG